MKKQKKRDLPTGTLFHGNKNVLQNVERNKIYLRKNSGITLIALIISIIVLLILAGVSLTALLGDNGILNQATNAAEKTEIASEEEMLSQIVVSENADKIQHPELESNYHIGTDLYDKTLENGDIWNIVVINETQEDYGTGWTFIKKGTNLMDYGESKYSWLVNYNTGEKVRLEEGTYTQLDYSSSLAVTNGLVLNIDATNLEEGNWGDITVHGDVKYDTSTQSLLFNEDTENNPTGEGGYLELTKAGLDFSDGFTFEIYCNLSRLIYDNGSGYRATGLFCRMTSLDNGSYYNSMKFGFTQSDGICRFGADNDFNLGSATNVDDSSLKLFNSAGVIYIANEFRSSLYQDYENFYLTVVYIPYQEGIDNNNYDLYMIENKVDKILVYKNGILFGYTYNSHIAFENGKNSWNNDESPFFVGVCPWNNANSLYYLKGKVYTTRLYENSLTESEVLENYNATIAYRSVSNN